MHQLVRYNTVASYQNTPQSPLIIPYVHMCSTSLKKEACGQCCHCTHSLVNDLKVVQKLVRIMHELAEK